jgi:PPOX class probable F420-dependent enzyme
MSRRAATRMTDHEVETFLAGRRVANIATIGADGRPHVVAMWYGWAPDGRIAFATYTSSQKVVNLRRRAVLTALVEDGERYEELRGVQLKCDSELSEDRDTVNAVGESLYERYHAEASGPLTDEIRPFVHAGMMKRTAVLLDVVDIASWDHAKLGGEG